MQAASLNQSPHPSLVWLRDDLRLDDNPALDAASKDGPVVIVFVLEEGAGTGRPFGGALKWWLHQSLKSLASDLKARGLTLLLRRGDPKVIIPQLAQAIGAKAVHWNRRYYAWSKPLDSAIKSDLNTIEIKAISHKANVLSEPWEIKTGAGGPFKVFTPFFKAAQPLCDAWAQEAVSTPKLIGFDAFNYPSERLDDWDLHPSKPDWSGGLTHMWQPGENGAQKRLETFLDGPIRTYQSDRNVPGIDGTSLLSPHLRFGEISIRRVWLAARNAMAMDPTLAKDGQHFLSELGWREFSTHLIYHFESFPDESWKPAYQSFPWREDPAGLHAWQLGQTGYPIVDAGMRQLYQTGWMHNRVRMIVASFLIKHLLQDWRLGEEWFWDTLVDADIANNAAGWQWVAGSGADASPFFRIFNPMTQGEKFDPHGDYVRRFVPELTKLPDTFIHRPFDAPKELLQHYGVKLGQTYPHPIVDHDTGRKRALAALASLKEQHIGEEA